MVYSDIVICINKGLVKPDTEKKKELLNTSHDIWCTAWLFIHMPTFKEWLQCIKQNEDLQFIGKEELRENMYLIDVVVKNTSKLIHF